MRGPPISFPDAYAPYPPRNLYVQWVTRVSRPEWYLNCGHRGMASPPKCLSRQFSRVESSCTILLLTMAWAFCHAAPSAQTARPGVSIAKSTISYAAARPVLDALRTKRPLDLSGVDGPALAAAWPGWVAQHDADIRARLQRGDEDSVVNFWLYGTSFTTSPRATESQRARIGTERAGTLVETRLYDLIAGIMAPDNNERLRFSRRVVERTGVDLALPSGPEHAARALLSMAARMEQELLWYRAGAAAALQANDEAAGLSAYSAYYRGRGLSSDTSILADYAVERALTSLAKSRAAGDAPLRRVAVVGPGLDFTDKAEGYDFYPAQSLQPFAVIDSLIRLGLARPGDIEVTTLDVSPRILEHLAAARLRARSIAGYTLQLPLDADTASHSWHPELVSYWQRFGDRVGKAVTPASVPSSIEGVRMRAIRLDPTVVDAVVSRDLNIVLERLEPSSDAARFDLVIATNILVYYDRFDQTLALANVAHMLRPGGLFLVNSPMFPVPEMRLSVPQPVTVDFDQQGGDTLFWLRKQPLP